MRMIEPSNSRISMEPEKKSLMDCCPFTAVQPSLSPVVNLCVWIARPGSQQETAVAAVETYSIVGGLKYSRRERRHVLASGNADITYSNSRL